MRTLEPAAEVLSAGRVRAEVAPPLAARGRRAASVTATRSRRASACRRERRSRSAGATPSPRCSPSARSTRPRHSSSPARRASSACPRTRRAMPPHPRLLEIPASLRAARGALRPDGVERRLGRVARPAPALRARRGARARRVRDADAARARCSSRTSPGSAHRSGERTCAASCSGSAPSTEPAELARAVVDGRLPERAARPRHRGGAAGMGRGRGPCCRPGSGRAAVARSAARRARAIAPPARRAGRVGARRGDARGGRRHGGDLAAARGSAAGATRYPRGAPRGNRHSVDSTVTCARPPSAVVGRTRPSCRSGRDPGCGPEIGDRQRPVVALTPEVVDAQPNAVRKRGLRQRPDSRSQGSGVKVYTPAYRSQPTAIRPAASGTASSIACIRAATSRRSPWRS